MALRWSDFITPSTLQLAPLLELLIEPVRCLQLQGQVQLGLQEALVYAVRHGNGCDPCKCLRVRRIVSPNWVIWQVQDEGDGLGPQARGHALPEAMDSACGRGLFLIHHCHHRSCLRVHQLHKCWYNNDCAICLTRVVLVLVLMLVLVFQVELNDALLQLMVR